MVPTSSKIILFLLIKKKNQVIFLCWRKKNKQYNQFIKSYVQKWSEQMFNFKKKKKQTSIVKIPLAKKKYENSTLIIFDLKKLSNPEDMLRILCLTCSMNFYCLNWISFPFFSFSPNNHSCCQQISWIHKMIHSFQIAERKYDSNILMLLSCLQRLWLD